MTIISYRGPCSPGGVSGTISQVLKKYGNEGRELWWHLSGNRLISRQENGFKNFCTIPNSIMAGHYRYCNNFLWPLLHDLPGKAEFSQEDRVAYQQFNLAIAANICNEHKVRLPSRYFIHDYQLALCPAILADDGFNSNNISIYWHIPWPKSVIAEHTPLLKELAASMLVADQIGFQIPEYAENFAQFIKTHFSQCSVDADGRYVSRPRGNSKRRPHVAQLIVHPVGVDQSFWQQAVARELLADERYALSAIENTQYVLSVDRADYTKGVIERLHAIDAFFASHAHWRNQITFVQVTQRTRKGLPSFDKYWEDCNKLAQDINSRWSTSDWCPVTVLDSPVSPPVLAKLYKTARAMLVNPIRDGLNLTAKEYLACAADSGILLLSKGAGASVDLGASYITVQPEDPVQMATAISTALLLPLDERKQRMKNLRQSLQSNTLEVWWKTFADTASIEHEATNLSVGKRMPELDLISTGNNS